MDRSEDKKLDAMAAAVRPEPPSTSDRAGARARRKPGRPGGGRARIAQALIDALPDECSAQDVIVGLRITNHAFYYWCRNKYNPLPHVIVPGEAKMKYKLRKKDILAWLIKTRRAKAKPEYEEAPS